MLSVLPDVMTLLKVTVFREKGYLDQTVKDKNGIVYSYVPYVCTYGSP